MNYEVMSDEVNSNKEPSWSERQPYNSNREKLCNTSVQKFIL